MKGFLTSLIALVLSFNLCAQQVQLKETDTHSDDQFISSGLLLLIMPTIANLAIRSGKASCFKTSRDRKDR